MKKMHNKKNSFAVIGSFLTLLVGVWGVYASTNNVENTYSDVPINQQLNVSNASGNPYGVTNVVTNNNTTYALTTNGSVYAWGQNNDGQVGNGTSGNATTYPTTPTMIFDSTGQDSNAVDANVSQIVAGTSVAYAITTNGSVYAWGNNSDGQVGDGGTSNVTTPTMIFDSTGTDSSAVDAGVSQIFSVQGTTYAITTNGSVYAWGNNSHGQVGNGTTSNVLTPTMIFDSTGQDSSAIDAGVSQVVISYIGSLGLFTVYAITTNGSVYAWGNNSYGQVGNGESAHSDPNVQANDGIGTEGYSFISTPTMIFDSTGTDSSAVDANISQVVTNDDGTTYALTNNGSVYAWGVNAGQVGNGQETNPNESVVSTPTMIFDSSPSGTSGVINGVDVSQIITNSIGTTYAVTTNGSVYGWGDNARDSVGNGSNTSIILTPTMIFDSTGKDSSAIDADVINVSTTNEGTAYALTSTGSVYAWGYNYNGTVGNGTTTNVDTPTMIFDSTGTDSSAVDANINQIVTNGPTNAYAITTTGSVYGWGSNTYGQVGSGIIINDPKNPNVKPVKTPKIIFDSTGTDSNAIDADVSQLVTNNYTTYAITSSGNLYGWGNSDVGQVGNGSTTNVDTPTLVLDLNINISDVNATVNATNNTIDINYQLNIQTWSDIIGNITVTLYDSDTGKPIDGVATQTVTSSDGTTYNGKFTNIPFTQPYQNFQIVITYNIGGETYTQTSIIINPETINPTIINASLINNNTINYSINNIYESTGGTYTATLWNTTTNSAVSGVSTQTVTPKDGTAGGSFEVPLHTVGNIQVQLSLKVNGEQEAMWYSNTINNVNIDNGSLSPHAGGNSSILWVWIVIAIVITILTIGLSYLYWNKNRNKDNINK